MALNKAALQQDIEEILTDMRSREAVSDTEFASRLATAIDAYVKTATINYQTGLTSPAGPVTGTFTGNLS